MNLIPSILSLTVVIVWISATESVDNVVYAQNVLMDEIATLPHRQLRKLVRSNRDNNVENYHHDHRELQYDNLVRIFQEKNDIGVIEAESVDRRRIVTESSQPSSVSSDIPSDSPSDLLSSIPSLILSDSPSDAPSDVSSDLSSNSPSDNMSNVPSNVPSVISTTKDRDIVAIEDNVSLLPLSSPPSSVSSDTPSDSPSNISSNIPSDAPSDTVSDVPSIFLSASSNVPSNTPSDHISDVPSSIPSIIVDDASSSQPSSVSSNTPSDTPSDISSNAPSDAPSDTVSDVPSILLSASSDVPSNLSSDIISDVPSSIPSIIVDDASSSQPSSVSSNTPSDTPSDIASNAPSDAPSDMPSAAPRPILGLNLVEAESGILLTVLHDGDIIERSTIGFSKNMTIVAETMDIVETVRFVYDGITHLEGVAPYAMYGKALNGNKFWPVQYLSTDGLKMLKVDAYDIAYTKSIDEVVIEFSFI